MGTRSLIVLLCLVLTTPVWADDGLQWEYDTTTGTIPTHVTLRKGPNSNGPFTDVKTIPALPATYTFPDAPDNAWYVISTPTGPLSNSVLRTPLPVAYDDTALKAEITDLKTRNTTQDVEIDAVEATTRTLETRLNALEAVPEPPTSTSRVIVNTLSATTLEVTCVSGTRPATILDKTGLKRLVTCP